MTIGGLIAAVPTPVDAYGEPQAEPLIAYCHALLANGCAGINLLGTTGEATSLPVAKRAALMAAVAESGLDMGRFMVGTGAAALDDAVYLTGHAMELGFHGALVLPPFYYKGLKPAEMVSYFDALASRCAAAGRLAIYFYHFPQNTGLHFTAEIISELRERHPGVFIGLKDSSGDLEAARKLAATQADFAIYPSAEIALSEVEAGPFAGVISASANLTAPLAAEGGAQGIARAVALRTALSSVPLVPAVKWAVARVTGNPVWNRPLLPLTALTADEVKTLEAALGDTAFADAAAKLGG